MLIWENDVQIVTSLLKDTINEYIYYENRQIQTVQAQNNAMFVNIVEISIGLLAFSLVSMIIVSEVYHEADRGAGKRRAEASAESGVRSSAVADQSALSL